MAPDTTTRPEGGRERTIARLQAVLEEASRLLTLADRDAMLRDAVEFSRQKLGVDRCGIFLLDPDGEMLHGSFGTDERGQTSDERALRMSKSMWPWAAMQERVKAGSNRWFQIQGDHLAYHAGERLTFGAGWIVATPISVAGDRLTGVMFNDAALSGAPLDVVQQELLAVFCSLLGNILDRKKAETDLREREAMFRGIFADAAVGTAVVSPEEYYLQANRAFCELVGYSEEELRARTVASITHPDDQTLTFEHLCQGANGGPATSRMEKRYVHKSGRAVWAEVSSAMICDAQGRPRYYIRQVLDISVRKQAEEERSKIETQMQYVQKLESLGVLAGGIAHDFNNLLTAIVGNADLALAEISPESPGRDCLGEILKVSRQAAELCKQMLAYSGKGKFVVELLDASRVVEEMAHMLEVSVSKKALLHYDMAPNLPPIKADATQVRQIVMNLIMNASDAIGDRGGVISLRTGLMTCDRAYLDSIRLAEAVPEGPYVFIEVADTGCGMDKETMARMFDPFFTTKFTGRGLGLAAVQGIVRGHLGAIKVYSEPGQGTTVKVLLPACEEPATAPSRSREHDGALRGSGTVLVVDDEESVRSIAGRMLARAGFTVMAASNGREGIEKYKGAQGEIVCVLLDLTMPECDGEETFRQLRAIDPTVRVVLTSGYNEQDATQHFSGKGLAGFAQKPFRMNDLVAKINAAARARDGVGGTDAGARR